MSEAALNGKSLRGLASWQPDLFTVHDGRHVVVEVKTLSSRGRGGPAAGGSVGRPQNPAGGGAPPAAQVRAEESPPRVPA